MASIAAVLPFTGAVPILLGYPDARHYLFFFENSTELRPTGGFLGVYGALTVKDADIAEMHTDDVYALDGPSEKTARPAPPAPIRKYIGIDKWYLRDANWSPDFSVSAAIMERFYREEYAAATGAKDAPPIDGIVAITPAFAEDVMRIVGPVTVQGKTFTADNLVDELQFQVEQGFVQEGIPFDRRKDIVGELVREVVGKLAALPLSRLIDALGIANRAVKEGHILAYAKDPAIQKIIDDRGMAGHLAPVAGDYFRLVDANLASLKTDGVMERNVRYEIAPSGSGFEGKVIVTYRNKGTFTWKTSRYRTYARLYVPAGTELLGVDGAMENDKIKDPGRHPGKADVYDELDRRAFGAFISIEPGETRTLTFRFRLAPSVAGMIGKGTYHLDAEKQPGTIAHGLTLDLDFGKKLTSAVPGEDRKEWGDTRYRLSTDLRIDRAFEVKF